MLHLHPQPVAMEAVLDAGPAILPRCDRLSARPELAPGSCCLSSAAEATSDNGRRLLTAASTSIRLALVAESRVCLAAA